MSSLIEQAAARLRQLREAGAELPEPPPFAARPSGVPRTPDIAPVPGATAAPPAVERRAPLVELDVAALSRAGLVTPGGDRSELAEEFRVVKRPIIANAAGKGAAVLAHGNLVMVTSALPGEGKSFTAVNLAMSIADELDHTVMLVDADVGRPSLPRILGFEPRRGLLDVLQGEAELADVLFRTNIPKLTVLPSGTTHPRATELLASHSMKALLDDIATRYRDRIVIFDSPPLLLTTESRVLATHMGQIVVVVQAGHTPQADVESALSFIERCPLKMLLLNQARPDALGRGTYGYGRGYGYRRDPVPTLPPDTAQPGIA